MLSNSSTFKTKEAKLTINDCIAEVAAEDPWLVELSFDWRSIPEDDERSLLDALKAMAYMGRSSMPNQIFASLSQAVADELNRRSAENGELVEPPRLMIPPSATDQELFDATTVVNKVCELPMRRSVGKLFDCYLAGLIDCMGHRLTVAEALRGSL
jgi:hypothetical protein